MSIVDDIENHIKDFQNQLELIQQKCSHPFEVIEVHSCADEHDYGTRYFRTCYCTFCHKRWEENC